MPGLFHAWGRQIIAGIGWEIVAAAVAEDNGRFPDFADLSVPFWHHQVRVAPDTFAALCDERVLAAGADLRLHTMLARLQPRADGWTVTLCGKSGLENVEARLVIDCTGDASAAALAGAPLLVPDRCQPSTLSCKLAGYNLATLDLAALDRAFAAAVSRREVQAEDACWRTDRPTVSGWLRNAGNNANHIRAGSEAATSRGRTLLEVEGRRAVRRIVRWLRTQPGLSGLRVECVYPEVGVRETVRIEGEVVIGLDDYRSGRVWPDALCYAFYPIDKHGMDSQEWQVENLATGVVPTVPRGALIPRGSRRLLAAGRIVSSDRLAFSALRVQAACMAMGQAAGAMAALSSKSGTTPLELELEVVRDLLRQHGAIVPGERPDLTEK